MPEPESPPTDNRPLSIEGQVPDEARQGATENLGELVVEQPTKIPVTEYEVERAKTVERGRELAKAHNNQRSGLDRTFGRDKWTENEGMRSEAEVADSLIERAMTKNPELKTHSQAVEELEREERTKFAEHEAPARAEITAIEKSTLDDQTKKELIKLWEEKAYELSNLARAKLLYEREGEAELYEYGKKAYEKARETLVGRVAAIRTPEMADKKSSLISISETRLSRSERSATYRDPRVGIMDTLSGQRVFLTPEQIRNLRAEAYALMGMTAPEIDDMQKSQDPNGYWLKTLTDDGTRAVYETQRGIDTDQYVRSDMSTGYFGILHLDVYPTGSTMSRINRYAVVPPGQEDSIDVDKLWQAAA